MFPAKSIVKVVFGFLFPGAPAWIGELLAGLIPAIFELVSDLEALDMPGRKKAETVIKWTRETLDELLDDVPEWRDLPEEKKDRILDGLNELALFAVRVGDSERSAAASRQLKKALRRKLKGLRDDAAEAADDASE